MRFEELTAAKSQEVGSGTGAVAKVAGVWVLCNRALCIAQDGCEPGNTLFTTSTHRCN